MRRALLLVVAASQQGLCMKPLPPTGARYPTSKNVKPKTFATDKQMIDAIIARYSSKSTGAQGSGSDMTNPTKYSRSRKDFSGSLPPAMTKLLEDSRLDFGKAVVGQWESNDDDHSIDEVTQGTSFTAIPRQVQPEATGKIAKTPLAPRAVEEKHTKNLMQQKVPTSISKLLEESRLEFQRGMDSGWESKFDHSIDEVAQDLSYLAVPRRKLPAAPGKVVENPLPPRAVEQKRSKNAMKQSQEDVFYQRAIKASLASAAEPAADEDEMFLRAIQESLEEMNKPQLSNYDYEAAYEAALADSLSAVYKVPESEQVMRPGYPRMQNMGATCFVASAVQLLSHSRILTEALRNPLPIENRAASEFRAVVDQTWAQPTADTKPVVPEKLVGALGLNPGQMGDVQFVVNGILGALQEASPEIGELYAVRFEEETECSACKAVLYTGQAAHVVPLVVPSLSPSQDFVTLEECWMRSFGTDNVQDYKCGACKRRSVGLRTTRIETSGDVLLIKLNRVIFGEKATPVTYRQTLKLGCGTYNLIGVAFHEGPSNDEGHFWAYFYHHEDGVWVEANDKVLTTVEQPPLTSNMVSMLIYERQFIAH